MAILDIPEAHNYVMNFEGGSDSLNNTLESMMEKIDNEWICKVCGKSSKGNKDNLRKHVESKHMDGVSYPCQLCNTTFWSRSAILNHNFRKHHV